MIQMKGPITEICFLLLGARKSCIWCEKKYWTFIPCLKSESKEKDSLVWSMVSFFIILYFVHFIYGTFAFFIVKGHIEILVKNIIRKFIYFSVSFKQVMLGSIFSFLKTNSTPNGSFFLSHLLKADNLMG